MVALANSSDKIIRPQGRLKITKEIILLPFRLHAFRKAAITWPWSLLLQNGLRHFVPHVILHLMIYRLSLQKNGGPYREGRSFFLAKQRKPVHRFVTIDFFSISYKSMDAYRCMFVLCTINGPCAWHQAIAGLLTTRT